MFSRTSTLPTRKPATGVRLLAVLILTLGLLLPAAPAHAAGTPKSWAITEYRADATLQQDGQVRVLLTLDFDFAADAGHGPFLVFPTRQRVADDPGLWRELDVQVNGVTSPTGANTTTERKTDRDGLTIRVGDENVEYTGVQRYEIDYTVRGVTAPNNPVSGLDELNWNVVGPAWQVPIHNAVATVSGPVAPERVACFTGSGFNQPCAADASQGNAEFSATELAKETGVQIVAGYPVGTLVGAEPRFSKRTYPGNMFPLTPATGGAAAALTAIVLALVGLRVRRQRDEAYAGLTPGLAPQAGAETVQLARPGVVAVQFSPPRGVRPGEAGTLLDHRADNQDVTGTIVDLAVRGHLSLQDLSDKQWQIDRMDSTDPLEPYEQELLDGLFAEGPEVTTKQLRDEAYSAVLTTARTALNARVTERGWYRRDPAKVRARAVGGGIGLIVLGAVAGFALSMIGWGLLGLPLVIGGTALLVTSGRQLGRTAEGSAVLAQVRGFEQYLKTAEAHQLRWEEGEDIFSKYLPWAIVFGVADRWAKLFQQLADEGRYDPSGLGWYHGAALVGMSGFGEDGFTSAMSESLTASVSAGSSSGGSGFSGGGGAGGGGGGGW